MATTTPNYGWVVPTSTDLVKDGATAIETLGDSIDASFVGLKGGTTGQVLSKTSGTDLAFSWIEQDDTTLSFNAQTGTTYTLVASDSAKLVTTSNASAVTVTVPPDVFTTGNQINVQSIGVGLTTFAAGAGVTITSTGATAAAPILRKRYSACTIICTASNTFTIIGDIV
jgi:ATP-dependent protease HslVU (ClpYQ) peptidase subunit